MKKTIIALTALALTATPLAHADTGTITPASVVRDVDGDTVIVATEGNPHVVVRLLGIDAPESVKPGYTVACGGEAASAFAKATFVPGTYVELVNDPTQDSLDKYGRTLAYVVLPQKNDYSILAASLGIARPYVFHGKPVQEAAAIEAASADAKAKGLGIWGAPCFGSTPSVPKGGKR